MDKKSWLLQITKWKIYSDFRQTSHVETCSDTRPVHLHHKLTWKTHPWLLTDRRLLILSYPAKGCGEWALCSRHTEEKSGKAFTFNSNTCSHPSTVYWFTEVIFFFNFLPESCQCGGGNYVICKTVVGLHSHEGIIVSVEILDLKKRSYDSDWNLTRKWLRTAAG